MKILVVDDDKVTLWSLKEKLMREGFSVTEAVDGKTFAEALAKGIPELVLLDLQLPDTDGLTLLRTLREEQPQLPVIMITGNTSARTAVEAMKLGAFDYVLKPIDFDELLILVNRALETARLRRRVNDHDRELKARFGVQNLVGTSEPMRNIVHLIRQISPSEASSVLIRGESGTGKDVVAKALHYESPRAGRPFMNITCTALQDTLLESELFGHEKGSFTDAKAQKKGLFEVADGGTMFLDEIGDMSPTLQAKLLRVLEERAFRRVGGTEYIGVKVRVIAATTRDLEAAIAAGAFGEELYYRLNVVAIDIPPLRKRTQDIPLLVEHFLCQFGQEHRRKVKETGREAMEKLIAYHWPGNIRELRNLTERAVLLSEGEDVSGENILPGIRGSAPLSDRRRPYSIPPDGINLDDLEKELVLQALERFGGKQEPAGKLLGLTRHQILYRMKKFGLVRPRTSRKQDGESAS